MNDESRWNAPGLMQLASAYWPACTLFAAVRLGLTQALAQKEDGATAEELAAELDCSLRGTMALLDGLAAIELLVKENECYRLHPEAKPLLSPGHFLDRTHIILHMSDIVCRWDRLDDIVRQGYPTEWSTNDVDNSPEHRTHYYRGMNDIARVQVKGVAARLGLQSDQHLLDLGGGHGLYSYTFADETPGLKATVYDLAGSQPFFDEERARHSEAANVDFRAGDFTEETLDLGGPYDAAWLSQILHMEGPEVCTRVLTAAAKALKPGGVLWIQEFVLEDDRTSPLWPALFNINMLVHNREGKSYSKSELRSMMENAGLRNVTFDGPTHPGTPSGLMRGEKP